MAVKKKAKSKSRGYRCAGPRRGCGGGGGTRVGAKSLTRKRPAKKKVSPRARARAGIKEKETMKRKRKKTAAKRKASPARRRRRKSNPGTVVAANPSPRRRRRSSRKRKANPGKRRHHHKRRKNPGIGGMLLSLLVGTVGAGVSALAGGGINRLALTGGQRAAAKAALGVAGGVPLMMLSPAGGVGFAGGLLAQSSSDAYAALASPSTSTPTPAALGAIRERYALAGRKGMNAVRDLEAVELQLGAVRRAANGY